MKALLLVLALAPVAVAQHPDTLPLARYSEPTTLGVTKSFRVVRTGNQVDDTTPYTWFSFGKVGQTDDAQPLSSYQLRRNRATVTYYFTVTDTSWRHYATMDNTEDSDAVFEIEAPLVAGNSWQYQLTDTAHATILAVDTSVSVAAGTFAHCVVVRIPLPTETTTNTYAPDVGLIASKTVDRDFTYAHELTGVTR